MALQPLMAEPIPDDDPEYGDQIQKYQEIALHLPPFELDRRGQAYRVKTVRTRDEFRFLVVQLRVIVI